MPILAATTHCSGGVEKETGREEREIVAAIETVPAGTEDKDAHCAMRPFVHGVTQPVGGRLVPVVEQLL